jgi:hypothetical protein
LTYILCLIISLHTPIRLEVGHAKTRLFIPKESHQALLLAHDHEKGIKLTLQY